MAALVERLQALYVDELRQSLVPPVGSMINRRQTEALIRRARTIGPAAYTEPDATTWIWSDLHLDHEPSRSVFGRPFPTAAAADEAMMEAWYEQVAEGERIICLGDVTVDGEPLAHHQECWRKAPGAKWLVLGNHDIDPVNQIHPFEIDRTAVTLYAAGDPPLLLTHVPLLQVPHGAVKAPRSIIHSRGRPILEPTEQIVCRLGLDDPVAHLRQAIRILDALKLRRQPRRCGCIELPRRLTAQQFPLALLTALFHPFRSPLLNRFGQHRPYLLKPRQRPGHRPAKPTRQQHLRRPLAERRSQILIILLPQQIDQRPQQRWCPCPIPIRLQRDQRRHQVARREVSTAKYQHMNERSRDGQVCE